MRAIKLILTCLVVLSGRDVLASARVADDRELADDNCPTLYPKNIAFNLSKEFLINKVNVSMQLSDIVNRDIYGPIEDLVEEQRKIYERFDGFSDFNDQALVAKTKDAQVCFVTFQGTDSGNGLLAFALGELS